MTKTRKLFAAALVVVSTVLVGAVPAHAATVDGLSGQLLIGRF